MSDKPPVVVPPVPADTEAEACALGCVLAASNGEIEGMLDQLDEFLFYDFRHVEIFRNLLGLQFDHLPVDVVALVQRLEDRKRMQRGGGLEYVSNLPNLIPSPLNFPTYVTILKDRAARRKMIAESESLRTKAFDLAKPIVTVERPIIATPIGELSNPDPEDPAELLRHRFLCQRMSLLFVGSTGKGKSSALLQALALWANALPFFGITPTRYLRSVYIQAENDDGDIAAIRNGIVTGLKFTEEQAKAFFTRVLVFTETALTGRRFCEEIVRPLLANHKPDLCSIDPALSYLGGDSKEQRDVGAFLRNYLNPLLFDHNCAAIVNHHTNKPSAGSGKKGGASSADSDFAYYGSGSAEWANWARAILALEGTRTKGVFRLHAAKRGQKIGWKDAEEKILYSRMIAHSKDPNVIYWRDAEENELPEGATGRPKQVDLHEMLDLLKDHSLSTADWQKAAAEEAGISRASFYRGVKFLQAEGHVLKSKINRKWCLVTAHQQELPPSENSAG